MLLLLFCYAFTVVSLRDICTVGYRKQIKLIDNRISNEDELLNKYELLNDKFNIMLKRHFITFIILILSIYFCRLLFSDIIVGWIWWYILFLIVGNFLWAFLKT